MVVLAFLPLTRVPTLRVAGPFHAMPIPPSRCVGPVWTMKEPNPKKN